MPQNKIPLIPSTNGSFDLHALAATLPDSAETMLLDLRLTDEPAASARIFRVYSSVPAHYHQNCDEHLLVVSGRAKFALGEAEPMEVAPGQMQFFRRGTVHGFPEILEHPFVIFSIDTPRRDPTDVHFVDAGAGTADTFIPPCRDIEQLSDVLKIRTRDGDLRFDLAFLCHQA